MSTAPLHPPGTPAEFRGQARAFLNRIAAAEPEYLKSLAGVMLPLRDRYHRRAKLPAGDTAAAEEAWIEKLPTFGRIDIETRSSRVRLYVRELRAFARMEGFDEWAGASEPALVVMVVGVDLRRDHLDAKKAVLATIGLHALARRFQRGFDTSDEALFSEFRAIAAVANDIIDAREVFRIQVPDGVWAGAVASVTDERGERSHVVSIRTFI